MAIIIIIIIIHLLVYNAYYAYILRTNDQQRRQHLWICDIFIYLNILNKAFVIIQYMDQQLLLITEVCKRQSIMNENGCVVNR
jgi:hypothetical protein